MAFSKLEHNTQLLVEKTATCGHYLGVSARFADNSGLTDGFGRLRVSNPTAIFSSQANSGENPIQWHERITNNSGNAGSSYGYFESTVVLNASTNDKATRQSKRYHRYQPGKSQFVMMTFVGAPSATGLAQRVGYFDDDNGIFFEQEGGENRMVRRTNTSGSPVNNNVRQSDWNLDPLDGSGESGIVLDPSKSQIWFMDMEWLGVGRVRTGFVIDGKYYYAHEFNNANSLDKVYIRTGELPVRYEIEGGSALASLASLSTICATVVSEGGIELESGFPFSIGRGTTTASVTDTERALVSIRPKLLNTVGQTNRTQVVERSFDVFSEDNPIYYRIWFGGSLTGASWQDVNTDYSDVEYDIGASLLTGGICIDSGFVPAGNQAGGAAQEQFYKNIPLELTIDGSHPTSPLSDILTITAERIGTNNSDALAELSWVEMK